MAQVSDATAVGGNGVAAAVTAAQDASATSPWPLNAYELPAGIPSAQVPRLAAAFGAVAALPDVRPTSLREVESPGLFRSVDPEIRERVIVLGEVPAHGVEQNRRLAATLHQVQMERGIRAGDDHERGAR